MGELEKHARIFNVIAPVYNWYFHKQVKNYRSLIDHNEWLFQVPTVGKVLDIGCGTGAFLYCLAERGHKAVGVDFSQSMLREAQKSTIGKSIEYSYGDVTKGLDFPDKSFNLVFASYVLHGLSSGLRQRIYSEAKRLSQGKVIFYDYNQNRRFLTDIAEWAEGGYYFWFIRNGEKEMRALFPTVEIINEGTQTALYVCTPRSGSS